MLHELTIQSLSKFYDKYDPYVFTDNNGQTLISTKDNTIVPRRKNGKIKWNGLPYDTMIKFILFKMVNPDTIPTIEQLNNL